MKTKMKTNKPSDVILMESCAANVVTLAGDGDEEKKQFKMLAYSGAEVQMYGERAIFNVAKMKIASQKAPIFRQHDPNRIAGFSTKIEKTGDGQVAMEGVLCPSSDAGREVANLAADGFPWQASVGLSDVRWKFVGKDSTEKCNGRDIAGPIYIAESSVLRESSFVPLGADGATTGVVMSADFARPKNGGNQMADQDVSADDQKIEAEKQVARDEALKAERGRVATLRAAFKDNPEFAMAQIEKGSSLVEAKAEYADYLLEQNAKLAAENASIKEAAAKAQLKPEGAAPVPMSESTDVAAGAPKDFIALAREHAQKTGKPLHAAMSEVSAKHPEIYAKMDQNLAVKQHQVAMVASKRGRAVAQ
jgi:hypothetical protein